MTLKWILMGLGLLALALLIWAVRRCPTWRLMRAMKNLGWPWKAWLAFAALLACIAGGVALTLNRVWLIAILVRAGATEAISNIAQIDTLIIGAVILSLGFAITPRVFKVGSLLETRGGQGENDAE